jgi:hypothetical protein
VACPVPGATLRVDGTTVGELPLKSPGLEVNAGVHGIEVAHEGYRTFRTEVSVTGGGETIVRADLTAFIAAPAEPRRTPVYRRWWLWTVVGVVVAAGAVTGGVLGARGASSDFPELTFPTVQP